MKKGFTLIELLIVMAIIAVLAATIFVAVDPVRRFAEARNARRWSEVVAILNAVLNYTVDNDGILPDDDSGNPIPLNPPAILGTSATGCNTCLAVTTSAACLDLSSALVDAYIVEIPKDPKNGTDFKTGYYIKRSASNRITVGACEAELGEEIRTTR